MNVMAPVRSLKEIRADLVRAHRAQDWEAAARLSQEKQRAKRKLLPTCQVCGAVVNRNATRCGMHNLIHRFYGRALGALAVGLMGVAVIAGAKVERSGYLEWTFDGVHFRIYSTTNMRDWTLYRTVTNVTVRESIALDQPKQFFRVTTYDPSTGLESEPSR